MKRKTYQRPSIADIVTIYGQNHLLSGSEQATSRPSASFMSNPDIGNDDNSSSVKAHTGVVWD